MDDNLVFFLAGVQTLYLTYIMHCSW